MEKDYKDISGIILKAPVIAELSKLRPNPWNPNQVAKPELKLLKLSIQVSGFCFPIVVIKEIIMGEWTGYYIIIDGYHRHLVAQELNMQFIPIVIIEGGPAELRAATVRFNRARGKHQVVDQAKLVREMVQENCTDLQICEMLGMTADELLRLKQTVGVAKICAHEEYSNAWGEKDNEI